MKRKNPPKLRGYKPRRCHVCGGPAEPKRSRCRPCNVAYQRAYRGGAA